MNIDTLIAKFSFIICIIFLFFSLLQLVYKKKLHLNYYLAVLFFATGYQFFYYWLFSSNKLDNLSFLRYTDNSFIFLIGPLIHGYFLLLSGISGFKTKRIFMHSIPFIVSLVYISVINIFHPQCLNYTVVGKLFFLKTISNVYITAMITLANLSLFTYQFITLKKIYFFFAEKKKLFEIKIILLLLLLSTFSSVLLNAANILSNRVLIYISLAGFSILPLFFILFSFRYPEFSMQVIKESRRIRYKHTIKSEYNNDFIVERLLQVMETDKPYIKEDISLATLSSYLMITPHQLSRMLNEHFHQNFNTFINGFRITEAKRLLIKKPELSILEIAFETGFSTKSSFYTNFVKRVGISPGEFKKNCTNS